MFSLSPNDTVHSRLRHWSVTSPNTSAFIFVSETGHREAFTRKEFYSLSLKTSSWLSSRGVKPGDVVATNLPPSPEQFLVVAGATLLGAVTVCVFTVMEDGCDIIKQLSLGDVTALVLNSDDVSSVSVLKRHIDGMTSEDGGVSSGSVPTLRTLIHCRRAPSGNVPVFMAAVRSESEAEPSPSEPDDVVTLMITSGSTGWVKLVPRTHREVLAIGKLSVEAFGYKGGDVMYNPSSCGWISGYICDYLVGGFTRVSNYVQESPPADYIKLVWQVLVQEKVTAGLLKPLQIQSFAERRLELERTCGAWKARAMSTGSYPVKDIVAGAVGTVAEEVRVVYGSSETGFNTVKILTHPSQAENFNCGKPIQNQELKIVDDDDNVISDVGQRGFLMVRNDVILTRYVKQDDETKACVTDDGWYRTGDTAWRDAKGDYFVEGRTSDLINVLGYKLSPQMMESKLQKHPAVEEVAVVGVPDAVSINRPVLCVVRKRKNPTSSSSSAASACPGSELEADEGGFVEVTKEELLKVIQDGVHQGLLAARVARVTSIIPKYCLFFDEFPKSWTGKLQRRELRELVLRRLGVDA